MILAPTDPHIVRRVISMRVKLNNDIKLTQAEASELIESLRCKGFYFIDLDLSGYTFGSLDMEHAVVGGSLYMKSCYVRGNNSQDGMNVGVDNYQDKMVVNGYNSQIEMKVGGNNSQIMMEVEGDNSQIMMEVGRKES